MSLPLLGCIEKGQPLHPKQKTPYIDRWSICDTVSRSPQYATVAADNVMVIVTRNRDRENVKKPPGSAGRGLALPPVDPIPRA